MGKPKASPRRKLHRRPTTVYFEPDLARAVKLKAAMTGMSVSEQLNRVLRRELSRDEADLRLMMQREGEPTRDYMKFLADLKRDGLV